MTDVPFLLVGTNNPGKLAEFRALLAETGIKIVSPRDLMLDLEVPESGNSYAENAARKAAAFAYAARMPALADDSGLEVDALGGKPGVLSHRFAPDPQASDADRRQYLLSQLADHPQPWTARFRCIIAVASPGALESYPPSLDGGASGIEVAEGVCEGVIIPEERGEGGFGYDPIFLLPELGRTMAELTMEEKNRVSHRARAAAAARPLIEKLYRNF